MSQNQLQAIRLNLSLYTKLNDRQTIIWDKTIRLAYTSSCVAKSLLRKFWSKKTHSWSETNSSLT